MDRDCILVLPMLQGKYTEGIRYPNVGVVSLGRPALLNQRIKHTGFVPTSPVWSDLEAPLLATQRIRDCHQIWLNVMLFSV